MRRGCCPLLGQSSWGRLVSQAPCPAPHPQLSPGLWSSVRGTRRVFRAGRLWMPCRHDQHPSPQSGWHLLSSPSSTEQVLPTAELIPVPVPRAHEVSPALRQPKVPRVPLSSQTPRSLTALLQQRLGGGTGGWEPVAGSKGRRRLPSPVLGAMGSWPPGRKGPPM